MTCRNFSGLCSVLLCGALLLSSAPGAQAGPDWWKLKKIRKKDKDAKKKIEVIEEPQPDPAVSTVTSAAKPATGSLFSEDAAGTELLVDFKPHRVGDLVFVDVTETSNASVSSGAKRSRDSGNVGGLTSVVGALPGASAGTAAGVIGAMGTRKYEGSGSTQRKTTLQARIAARVVEVLPNGDLVIEARKLVKINKENETLRLSGIIRRRDVTADNAIPTTSIGNLYVELDGKGMASADNAPGWLYRFFEKINPF